MEVGVGSKTCSSCGGSGYNAQSGVMPGSQPNGSPCMTCGGKGWVSDNSYGGGSTDCFPGSARVLTPRGLVPIEKIYSGDVVVSLDPETGLVARKVFRRVEHERNSVMQVKFRKQSEAFLATPRHPILTKRGWVRIKHLRTGDVMLRADAKGEFATARVEETAYLEQTPPVYNLLIEDTYNYIVDGNLAHSFVYFPHFRLMLNAIRPEVGKLLSPSFSKRWVSAI